MSAGDSKVSLPSGAARGALRFQRNGVRVDPVEQPRAQPLDLAQAPLHAPSPFCIPLVQHVEEPDAHDGVGVDYAALRVAAPALVFNQCSGGEWLGRLERHKGADVGDLHVCERSGDALSRSPPPGRCGRSCRARSQSCGQLGRPADRSRLTGGQLRPTDRAMNGRPLDPHDIDGRRIQIN